MDIGEAIVGQLQAGKASAEELMQTLKISRRTLFRYIGKLVESGKVVKVGIGKNVRYGLPGQVDTRMGRQITEGTPYQSKARYGASRDTDPPLLQVRVTNPVTYLKRWWSRVMANEGVDVRFRIRPLTMIAVSAVLTSGGFVFGRVSLPEPVVRYIPQLAPSPSPNPWKETAFTGVLQARGGKYFLTTGEGEAISLEVPKIVNVQKLIGRKILAIGSFNGQTKILKVADASDVEILVGAQPAPLVASASATPR